MPFRDLLDDAQFFCDEAFAASSDRNPGAEGRYATASVLFCLMAIESFINDMMSDFASLPFEFTIHEQGFLQERVVQFVSSGDRAGRFEVTNRPEFKRLEDKILFLVARTAGLGQVDQGSSLWQKFAWLKDIRDGLTHPRKETASEPSAQNASDAVSVTKELIRFTAQKVWGKAIDI